MVEKARLNGECGSQERNRKSGRLASKLILRPHGENRDRERRAREKKRDQKTEACPAVITSLTGAAFAPAGRVAARRASSSAATPRRPPPPPPPGADPRRGAERKQS